MRLYIHQTMCLKRVEKKKLLGRHNKVAKWLLNYLNTEYLNIEAATEGVL